ncbi:adenomatous polyposis coli protein-like isoform X3 [Pomacea canaliculata]|uniref:adenomatous polyposis coli protein-like isoform X3 n=1 Tax=Pomacea canaliculata TaxID=400727 RepID=UPI000D7399A6|nr:adenomatous polyposis coli protein-like isoform X3 [Pomacea canaliculata]XP_025084133.1 adenomatous polyposis coli protein-like isoform X3 [Pomacea canaliculata]XP_025084134.1 adenomatous polyposis coli protein-like isoform X3 [Pomacea canaliculata]XP_025084135.1 adenomatous polyposis coli protein-like isoform X3 [Pomacea canaliculata]XP_025084136.1 adenomatous polyposis coli protein-like isoform X3 [Pomacea canaliculata]
MSQWRKWLDLADKGDAVSEGGHSDDSLGDTAEDEEEEEGQEEESGSEDNIVCFGLGEDDSDEVAEDETDGNLLKDDLFGKRGTGATGNSSLCEENDNSFEDDEDDPVQCETDADTNIICSSATVAMVGADNRAVYALMQELDQERSSILKEIEAEEQHRKWFYRQLEHISKKLENLPLKETYSLQTDMARRQLEYEAQQVRSAMTEKLGTTEQASQRQEARLQRIRSIESQMMQLTRQQQKKTAVDVTFKEAGTCTSLTRTMFVVVPGQENGGYTSDRSVSKAADGHYRATIATQTPDVTLTHPQHCQETQLGFAAGIPLSADMSSVMYHGAWPIHKEVGVHGSIGGTGDLASVMSYNSTNTSSSQGSVSAKASLQPQQLGTKVEMVYSLLSMLGTHDKDDMSRTLLAMSSSQDSCIAMRQSGCLPLLIQLLHGSDKDSGLLGNTRGSSAARARASAALHNIVHSNPDDKRGRREARTLRLLEQIRAHCDQQRGEAGEDEEEEGGAVAKSGDIDHHPGPAIAALMKLSFDEDYRHAICTLGGLQAIAELLEVDHMVHGMTSEQYSVTVRRYACMALTNLTFGDGKNKALLCTMHKAMEALVAQLRSPNEDLCQGAASVLRNLSWRADLASKKTLREVGAVTTLMEAAMSVKKETTLKSILSALWNLSSHCSENKAEICAVKGALEFLVGLLTFKSPGKTHAIVENGGGILRNVSSQIAVREDYRRILRQKGCLQLLLSQLRSTSLTIVSNACGTLWNLSARCAEDQQLLREMGAVSMLRNLVHSKHRMIAMGSSAALRNLLSSAGPGKGLDCDRGANGNRPTLSARKQRALEEELDQNLAETCDNVESPRDSPTDTQKSDADSRRFVYPFDSSQIKSDEDPRRTLHKRQVMTRCGSSDGAEGRIHSPQRVPRASSQDSVSSTHSDISHDRTRVHNMLAKSSHLLHRRQCSSLERKKDSVGVLHRVSSDNSCVTALERQKNGDHQPRVGQSSRIMQYMQEVAMLADLDSDSNQQSHHQTDHSGNTSGFILQSRPFPSMNNPQRVLLEQFTKNTSSIGTGGGVTVNPIYCKNETGGDSDGSEEPVNYSLKYQDINPNLYSEPSNMRNNIVQGNSHGHSVTIGARGPTADTSRFHHSSQEAASARIPGYTMGSVAPTGIGGVGSRMPCQVPNMAHNHFPTPQPFQQPLLQHHSSQPLPQPCSYIPRHRNVGGHQPISTHFSTYAETDLDSFDDQPTDFSLRYSEEHSDDQDQPVNYSIRYRNEPDPHCVECKYEEARRTNDRLDQGANDDQVLTFCTEGTPFLSTATSLMDLTAKQKEEEDDPKEAENDEDDNDGGRDELHNFSAQYGESEHTTEDMHERHQRVPGRAFSSSKPHCTTGAHQQSAYHGEDDSVPADQVKTYCEEGTPVCFSRVSSLSSLHSSEARDSQDHGKQMVLQSIDETEKNDAMSTSVIENKNAAIKTALVDKDTRRNRTDVEREPKTVTFDENRQVEETPLMFSRCSSLGSLSSFDTQSVHSSVVSEYSRRASEVVSPSELPDSPSETMPPSPTRVQSPPVKSFKPVAAVGAKAPVPVESIGPSENCIWQAANTTTQLLSMFRGNPMQNISNQAASISGKSEVPVVYADEGTPPVFSETSSLSALTVDCGAISTSHSESHIQGIEPDLSNIEETDLADVTLCEAKSPGKIIEDRESSMSEVSEGEEDILAQCINAAMPVPTSASRKLRKSSSDNTIKKKSNLPKPENTQLKSRLPTKVSSTVAPVLKSSKSPPSKIGKLLKPGEYGNKKPSSNACSKVSGSNVVAKPPRPSMPQTKTPQSQHPPESPLNLLPREEDYAADTLKTFATEGTPLNFSAAASLSDLSMMTGSEPVTAIKVKPSSHDVKSSVSDDSKSDNSSGCEETEQQLLTEMIQSAMPKSRAARKLELERRAEGAEAKKTTVTGVKSVPSGAASSCRSDSRKISSHLPQARLPTAGKVCFISATADVVKTYNTEGTPNNFSTATSLSDLTIDSTEDVGGSSGTQVSHIRSQGKSSLGHHSAIHLQPAYFPQEDILFPAGSLDSPRVFGMEGTPVTFSRNDSLSSLGIVDDEDRTSLKHVSNSRAYLTQESESLLHEIERHVIGQSSEESSIISEKHPPSRGACKDEMKKFAVEDTPISFSRNSSLSSLASGGRAREPQPEDEPAISRTSSCSSLSTESANFDPTPSEQALLDQCISAAMPKRRPSRGDDKFRRHARSVKAETGKCEPREVQEGGAFKSSALEVCVEFDNQSIGEAAVTTAPSTSEGLAERKRLMTRSCSDAIDVEADVLGRESRFSSWRRHRQLSSDEMNCQGSKLPWIRSRSQDSENFLKTQKNISNRITQSSSDHASSSSSSISNSRTIQCFLGFAEESCTTSVIEVDASNSDNRLLEQAERQRGGRDRQAGPIQSLVASITDSTSSQEKADSEKSIDDQNASAESGEHDEKESEEFEEENEEQDGDQDQTVLEVTVANGHFDDTRGDEDENAANDTELDEGSTANTSSEVIHYEDGLEEKLCFGSEHTSFDNEDNIGDSSHTSFEQEISPEDERLLQENASLIVTEIVTKRDMTGSGFEDDMFIENETISLVSNDYTSDTASEVSISWSTTSEKVSERSCSTVSQADTAGSSGPKIVKPSGKVAPKTGVVDDGKVVRGRRKPLYSNRSSTSSIKSDVSSTKTSSSIPSKSPRPSNAGVVNSKMPQVGGRGNPIPKKSSPKLQNGPGQAKSNIPGLKPAGQGIQKPSSTAAAVATSKVGMVKSNLLKTSPPATARPGSGIPRSPARGGNTPPSRLPSATSAVSRRKDSSTERPKPPLKQATFIKDAGPAVKDGRVAGDNSTSNVPIRNRSTSRGRCQSDKRNSGGSEGSSNQNGNIPDSWSKALDSFNFIVEKTPENGYGTPFKQMQRNAKDTMLSVKQASSSNGKQQRPSNIARPQPVGTPSKSGVSPGKSSASAPVGGKTSTSGPSPGNKGNNPIKSNLNKSGSASSLRKAGSGSSLTKTSSGSSLSKGASNTSLRKMSTGAAASKTELKKSDSSASLRRSSDISRPSTPIGRQQQQQLPHAQQHQQPSNPSVKKIEDSKQSQSQPQQQSQPSTSRRQVPSKIATLWRKEDSRDQSPSREENLPVMTTFKAKASTLPMMGTKNKSNSRTFVRKSSSGHSNSSGEDYNSSMEGIPRSSTYDKIPAHMDSGSQSSDEQMHSGEFPVSSGSGTMFELCDPTNEYAEWTETHHGCDPNLDEAYIQDDSMMTSDAGTDDAMMGCSVDSLEDMSPQNEEQGLIVPPNVIDSSTWKRKERPSKEINVSLQLPNADETCKSMCSFMSMNESQNESFARLQDSSVWQRHNDSIVPDKSLTIDASIDGKKSKNKKSVAKSIKTTLFGKSGLKFFRSNQSKEQAKLKELNEKVQNKKAAEISRPQTVSTGTTTLAKSISVPLSKPSPAAVVAPFNYSPPSSSQVTVMPPPMHAGTVATTNIQVIIRDSSSLSVDVSSTGDAAIHKKGTQPAIKHMTKTEMLLARRRQSYLNNPKQEEEGVSEEDTSKRGCMVTTV